MRSEVTDRTTRFRVLIANSLQSHKKEVKTHSPYHLPNMDPQISKDISSQIEAIMAARVEAPDWKGLIYNYLSPIEDLFFILQHALGPAWRYMKSHPLSLLSPSAWQTQLVSVNQPWLMELVDQDFAPVKHKVLQITRGVVLEIGAGSGETLKYYPMEKIDRIYGVEPMLAKCALLRAESDRLGVADKYHVLPHGIEDMEKLERVGITKGSIDTVVCVKFLLYYH
jgi:hypothetical protein